MNTVAGTAVTEADLAAVAKAFTDRAGADARQAEANGPDFIWFDEKQRQWEFTTFYRMFAPHLVSFLTKHGATHADAAEVSQDALSDAFRCWAGITTNPAAWCRTNALRKLWERKQSKSRETSLDSILEYGELPREWASGDNHFVVQESIEAVLARTHLLQALHRLPQQQRVIFCYIAKGYTPSDIADLLQLNPPTVRSSLRKARITLAGFADELLDEAC
ncbi:RNA polymerase sigma factor [Nocardia wallacei]|uniref:RNA polymerase sigma factor n=1 Tax=Nocardia wallacei TaxID=480035 RepID=UPI002457BD3D|nr:sigma-70 family RNA polymerase sigma factor [Nocardia wallacei]